jgi:hypothetical protein
MITQQKEQNPNRVIMFKIAVLPKSVQRESRVLPPRVEKGTTPTEGAVALHPLLRLQQTVGNQAVNSVIQTKLKVSQPGDRCEKEADCVADQVVRMSELGTSDWVKPSTASSIPERTCMSCEGRIQRQPVETPKTASNMMEEELAEEDDIVPDETGMPKHENGTSTPPASQLKTIRVPHENGRALEPGIRHFMEQRFGHGFDQVRVHTDAAAVKSARQLNALAYTVGKDIYFNEGQYDSGSFPGRRLLAHELTHVIQQTGHGEIRPSIQLQPAGRRRGARSGCSNSCGPGGCPQGKQPRVVRDDCSTGEPLNTANYISALNVSLSSNTVQVIWSAMVPGNTEVWPCSPNPSVTPKHSPDNPDTVGVKCSVNHTNRHRDGMAWFTGFASEGLRIGFHNSQPVGPGCVSHGCVRVCCDKAEIINKNTWSGRTLITVA